MFQVSDITRYYGQRLGVVCLDQIILMSYYVPPSSQEKTVRLKNMHTSLTSLKKKNKRIQLKVHILEKEAVSLHPEQSTDISDLISELNPTVEQQFPPDSPQHIFWEQQRRRFKEKRQMKWHPLESTTYSVCS